MRRTFGLKHSLIFSQKYLFSSQIAKDYYKILGVSKSASLTDIKEAYRTMAMKYHPDVNITGNFLKTINLFK